MTEPSTASPRAPLSERALAEIRWDAAGLLPVIVQDATTRQVLMVAWMNREALCQTVARGEMVYWSRSRQRLWHKGETSGNVQRVRALRLDCDGDVMLATVEQAGGVACHTGREHCFFRQLDAAGEWRVNEPVRTDPALLYGPIADAGAVDQAADQGSDDGAAG